MVSCSSPQGQAAKSHLEEKRTGIPRTGSGIGVRKIARDGRVIHRGPTLFGGLQDGSGGGGGGTVNGNGGVAGGGGGGGGGGGVRRKTSEARERDLAQFERFRAS